MLTRFPSDTARLSFHARLRLYLFIEELLSRGGEVGMGERYLDVRASKKHRETVDSFLAMRLVPVGGERNNIDRLNRAEWLQRARANSTYESTRGENIDRN